MSLDLHLIDYTIIQMVHLLTKVNKGPIVPLGSTGQRSMQGAKRLRGVSGIQGLLECKDLLVYKAKVVRKDTMVLKVLLVILVNEVKRTVKVILQMFKVYWPIIYRFYWRLDMEKNVLVKYHVSDRSRIVESSGGVETLRNVSPYNEPAWHFDGKFRANVQRAIGHGHFLDMKNSA